MLFSDGSWPWLLSESGDIQILELLEVQFQRSDDAAKVAKHTMELSRMASWCGMMVLCGSESVSQIKEVCR